MKKKLAKLLALTLVMGMTLTACGNGGDSNKDANANADGDQAAIVYAVEAGSAGEAAAQENGFLL